MKYQSITSSDCKDIGITKLEAAGKSEFLYRSTAACLQLTNVNKGSHRTL